MRIAYPHRVAFWRRALPGRPRLVDWVILAVPAITGAILLAVAIPSIAGVLSTETRLSEPERSGRTLTVATDCDPLALNVAVYPDGATRFSPSEDPASHLQIELTREPQDPSCRARISSRGVSGHEPPLLIDAEGGAVTGEGDTLEVEFGEATQIRIKVKWPGVVQYAHQGHGWVNRLLGERSAGVLMGVTWRPLADSVPRPEVYAGIQVFAPENFEVSYAQEAQGVVETERSPWEVTFSNRVDGEHAELLARLNVLIANVRFRTQDFEPKMNFILLLGGAVIGLGLTLLVESFIASVFRFQAVLTGSEGGPPPKPPEHRLPISASDTGSDHSPSPPPTSP